MLLSVVVRSHGLKIYQEKTFSDFSHFVDEAKVFGTLWVKGTG